MRPGSRSASLKIDAVGIGVARGLLAKTNRSGDALAQQSRELTLRRFRRLLSSRTAICDALL